MDVNYWIRRARLSDLDTLLTFTVREARETEGADPDLAAVKVGVQSGLEG